MTWIPPRPPTLDDQEARYILYTWANDLSKKQKNRSETIIISLACHNGHPQNYNRISRGDTHTQSGKSTGGVSHQMRRHTGESEGFAQGFGAN